MDDIRRAKVRTLMLVLRTIEEEVLKLADEEKKGSASDTTSDLEQALRAIATALDHLRGAAGNGEGTE
jgi:hypothetical protein